MLYRLFILISILSLHACQEKATLSDAYGNFEATVSTVSSEATGKLLFLNVEEGQKVSPGKLIALVDTIQLDLQRKQIEASMRTLPAKLRNTLADIEVLNNQRKNLVRERDRVQRLLAKKAATPKQLDDLNGEIEVVDKRIEAIRSSTKTANRAILSEQEPLLAQIAVINEKIKKSCIYNPVGGTVLTKMTEPHEFVGMGSPLYRIGKLDTMTLRFYASSTQLQDVKLDQVVEVLIDDGDDAFKKLEGRISWVSDQAEFTPKTIQTKEDRVNLVYAVKAEVPNPDGLIKIGMPAEVNFDSTEDENEESGQ